jgi:hypothetical protein
MVGCGPSQGKVTGQVMYDGKPLPGGRVLFQPVQEGLNSVSATLDEQGHFEVVLPGGEVKVSVNNQELMPHPEVPTGIPPGLPAKARAAMEKALKEHPKAQAGTGGVYTHKIPGKYVEIPKRYSDVGTSGLNFTVQRGDQTHNIELRK